MKTVHIVFSAHLDPVWLWPWQAGLAEAIATCRSACDRLDAHPDLFFTRGESWVYQQIERVDPALFERICGHVRAGQWEIVGGWHVQPDCNLPGREGMLRQIGIGRDYFLQRFGIFPKTAFNVDSFGHSASLPDLMASFGQDSYVMTRPSLEEMPRSSRVCRWRGHDQGAEVILVHPAFSNESGVRPEDLEEAVELVEGLDDALCCLGVGDHGGGPTEQQVAWCRENRFILPGWELKFSTVAAFMDRVRPRRESLPLLVGELQPHAIGCYSVHHQVKSLLHRAEDLLTQAESLRPADPSTRAALDEGWRRVAFHHFHDTLAGACIPSAYTAVADQLGLACTAGDEALHYALIREAAKGGPDELQQIVLLNAGDRPFRGFVEHEPWRGPYPHRWRPGFDLVDMKGDPVEFQLLDAECICSGREETVLPRLLFPASLDPGEVGRVRIRPGSEPRHPASRVKVLGGAAIENDLGVRVHEAGVQRPGEGSVSFDLQLLRDMTDTWGHGIDRFPAQALESVRWGDPVPVDDGPLMASLIVPGMMGSSPVEAEWRVCAGELYAELLLTVDWREERRVLKLVLNHGGGEESRLDGIMQGSLRRANDGAERPFRDWTLASGRSCLVGIMTPDCWGIDADPGRIRLTLLRSPLLAHHEPAPARSHRRQHADRGIQRFRLRFFLARDLEPEVLEAHASMVRFPPVATDSTRGMPLS